MPILLVALSLLLLSCSAVPRHTEGLSTNIPPTIHSLSSFTHWLDHELSASAKKHAISVDRVLLDTQRWSVYVNELHFVPLTCDGMPPGARFDFSWKPLGTDDQSKGLVARPRLPSAELTETGNLVFWWEKCNFYEIDEVNCRAFIRMAVDHEVRHYLQWVKLAENAVEIALGCAPKIAPRSLVDVAAVDGATTLFMSRWADCEHYQCREVEVYLGQLQDGEISPNDFFSRREILEHYATTCAASRWKEEFASVLQGMHEALN